jgi:hypothetical protein
LCFARFSSKSDLVGLTSILALSFSGIVQGSVAYLGLFFSQIFQTLACLHAIRLICRGRMMKIRLVFEGCESAFAVVESDLDSEMSLECPFFSTSLEHPLFISS